MCMRKEETSRCALLTPCAVYFSVSYFILPEEVIKLEKSRKIIEMGEMVLNS